MACDPDTHRAFVRYAFFVNKKLCAFLAQLGANLDRNAHRLVPDPQQRKRYDEGKLRAYEAGIVSDYEIFWAEYGGKK
jgi:hypothetical protein